MKRNKIHRKNLVNKYRELLLGYKEITIPFLTNNTDSSNYILLYL